MFVRTAPRTKRPYRSRGVPDYPPIGRQPFILHQTSPWYGSIDGAEALTVQQRRTVDDRGLEKAEVITVRRLASSREMWWPTPAGGKPQRPYFQFPCPIARHHRDGRIYVVAPGGEVKLVHSDGWVF